MYFSHHPCNKLSTHLPYPPFTPPLTQPNHPLSGGMQQQQANNKNYRAKWY